MIEAIFLDVDGTLLSHKTKGIPPDAEQALLGLREKGIRLFMATGRHAGELAKLPVGKIPFDGYITLNGQLCLDGEKRFLSGTPFGGEITDALVSMFSRKERPMILVDQQGLYLNYVNETVRLAQQAISTPVPEVCAYRGAAIYQAVAYAKPEEDAGLEAALPRGCKLTRWGEYGVDIIARDGGKARGLETFCRLYGIPRERIMAFGDGENDMDMLAWAGIGVAMGNAWETVKAAADYVTDDVDAGGIANALTHFGLLP